MRRATNGRWKTWAATGAGVLCLTLSLPVAVLAAGQVAPASGLSGSGDPNHQDVWVDNVGQPPGPGHEMDPHLACQNINLWGIALAEASGQFTVDGWPPSGSGSGDLNHPGYKEDQAWPGTKASPSLASWTYNQAQGGDQVMAVIGVKTLIADAIANGDSPVNGEGFHFKLQFLQDPQKHKTFWVDCPGPTPRPTPSGSSTPTPSSSSTPTPSSNQPTLTVVKSNDADGDGIYRQVEEAPSPGASVPFKVLITNTSQVIETITAITDSYASTTLNECQALVGNRLDPGSSVTCSFTISDYAPAAGTSLTDTVTVTVSSDGTSVQADGTSTVTTASPAGAVLGASTGTPGTGAGLEIGLTAALVLLGLTLLGLGRWGRRRATG